jgi:hypothetical protein
MAFEIMIILALGILNDVLVTLYYLFVGKLQALPASFLTILLTLLNFFVIEKLVVSVNWTLILVYALGSSIGCFAIILYQKMRLSKKQASGIKPKKKSKLRHYLF